MKKFICISLLALGACMTASCSSAETCAKCGTSCECGGCKCK